MKNRTYRDLYLILKQLDENESEWLDADITVYDGETDIVSTGHFYIDHELDVPVIHLDETNLPPSFNDITMEVAEKADLESDAQFYAAGLRRLN